MMARRRDHLDAGDEFGVGQEVDACPAKKLTMSQRALLRGCF